MTICFCAAAWLTEPTDVSTKSFQLARDQFDLQLIGLQPRQVEQVAEQAGQAVSVILDDASEAARRRPVVKLHRRIKSRHSP